MDLSESLIKDIDGEIGQLNGIIKQAQALNERIKQEREEYAKRVQTHNQAQIALNGINASIVKQREAIEASKSNRDRATAELNRLFAFDDWQERAKNDRFIEELEEKAKHYKAKEDEGRQLDRDIALIKAHIPAMQAAQANIKGLVDNGHTTDVIPDGQIPGVEHADGHRTGKCPSGATGAGRMHGPAASDDHRTPDRPCRPQSG